MVTFLAVWPSLVTGQQYAFVTTEHLNAVVVIDTGLDAMVGAIPLNIGSGDVPAIVDPTNIVATTDGRSLYIAGQGSGNVGVIDSEQRVLTRTIATGGNPMGVVLTPDGSRVYVNSFSIPGSVFVVDTAAGTVIDAIDVRGRASGIAVAPDGQRVYVSEYDNGTISVIQVETNTVEHQFFVGAFPNGIALSAAGALGVVASETPSAVHFFDPRGLVPFITGSVEVSPEGVSLPCAIALNRDGRRAYVTEYFGGFVDAVDTVEGTSTDSASIALPYVTFSCGIALTPDERYVYVANNANDVVSVLHASDLRVRHHIPVLPRPYGIAITCPGGCPTPDATATPTSTTVAPPTPTRVPCQGDCGGDGTITIDDIVRGVGIALGLVHVEQCLSLDGNADNEVSVEELVLAVRWALGGCVAAIPTPPAEWRSST